MRRLIPAAALLLASSACVSVPRLDALSERFRGRAESVRQAEALEAAQPQAAAARYRDILGATIVYKTVGDYQKQFATELSQIGTSDLSANLNDDSVLALSHVYDWSVEAAARARLGLARLAFARGDDKEAESQGSRAAELLNRYAVSPLLRALLGADVCDLLARAYAKDGKTGRARLAELDRDLHREYLASPAARDDEEADRRRLDEDEATIRSVDEYTAAANAQRRQKLAGALSQAAGSLSQAAGNLQQMQIDSALARSGGRVTPQIRQMQQTRQVMDFQRRMMSFDPDFAAGVSAMRDLSPFANLTAGRQLLNPAYGAKTPELIKTFASALGDASGDDKIKRAAGLVDGAVDGVVKARGGRPKDLEQALDKFTETFGGLQALADGMTGAAR